jgi:hypothetical protein
MRWRVEGSRRRCDRSAWGGVRRAERGARGERPPLKSLGGAVALIDALADVDGIVQAGVLDVLGDQEFAKFGGDAIQQGSFLRFLIEAGVLDVTLELS